MRYTWILVLLCVGLSCVGCSSTAGSAWEGVPQPVGAEAIYLDSLYRTDPEGYRRYIEEHYREVYRIARRLADLDEGEAMMEDEDTSEPERFAKRAHRAPVLIEPAPDPTPVPPMPPSRRAEPPDVLARQMRESLLTRINRFDSPQWQRIDKMLTLLENPPRAYAHAVDRNERAILADLTREMMQTGVSSQVTFTTAVDGAVVKYQAYGYDDIGTANGTTQDASAELPIGCYWFWSERNSKRTSKSLLKTILRENEGPIPIQEYGDD